MSPDFEDVLQWEPLVVMYVDFATDGRQVVSYSVVLAAMEDGALQTVMRAAIAQVRENYLEMIEGWRR